MKLLALSIFFAVASGCCALVPIAKFDDVMELIGADDENFLLFFSDSGDINSMRMKHLMEEVSNEVSGFVTVVEMDVRNPELAFFVNAWNVQVVPSLKLLPVSKGHRPNGSGGIKNPVDFSEQTMTVDAVKRFALSAVPSKGYVDRVDKDLALSTLTDAVSKRNFNASILVTDKDSTPLLFRGLALQFVQRLAFIEISKQKCPKLVKSLNVEQAPSLLVWNSYSRVFARYSGSLKIAEVASWLDQFAIPRATRRQETFAAKEKSIRTRYVKESG